MLNFKHISILFFVLLIIIVVINIFTPICFLFYIAILLIYLSILVYGSATISSNFFLKAITSGNKEGKTIAITFDDGPSEVTPLVLDLLKEYNIPAFFFVVGNNIKDKEFMLKRMNSEGHLIGNHGYSHHFWFGLFSTKRVINELKETAEIINNVISKKVKLFRPPYGVTNPNISRAVNKMKYITVGWSLKSQDKSFPKNKHILDRLKHKVKAGDIILFHDTNEMIVPVIKEFIEYALANDFKLISLEKLLNIKAYE